MYLYTGEVGFAPFGSKANRELRATEMMSPREEYVPNPSPKSIYRAADMVRTIKRGNDCGNEPHLFGSTIYLSSRSSRLRTSRKVLGRAMPSRKRFLRLRLGLCVETLRGSSTPQ